MDEIICNELQNATTVVASLIGLTSPIRQAMLKVISTFDNSFPLHCQKASVPIQFQILWFLMINGCDPQITGFSQLLKIVKNDRSIIISPLFAQTC